MSDDYELYQALKRDGQARRAKNRSQSPKLLEAAQIPFRTHNGGAHLIVEGPECPIDFWPGNGRWKSRKGAEGFGVNNLIRHIKGATDGDN